MSGNFYRNELSTGGCLCGAVRYRIHGLPFYTSYCHCEDCRRTSGSPVMVWSFFRGDEPAWVGSKPQMFYWADRERSFCGSCGTPLMFRDPAIPGIYEIATCTLDRAHTAIPNDHNWIRDQLPWFQVHDSLPRHQTYTPDLPLK